MVELLIGMDPFLDDDVFVIFHGIKEETKDRGC